MSDAMVIFVLVLLILVVAALVLLHEKNYGALVAECEAKGGKLVSAREPRYVCVKEVR